MTNPRKFSEKIALLQQKQQEEEEAFRKVMEDVHAVTATSPRQVSMPQPTPSAGSRLIPPNQGMLRGGSLPDVHYISQQGDNRNAQPGRVMSGSPRQSRATLGPGPVRHSPHRRTDTSPYGTPIAGGGGMNHGGVNAGSPNPVAMAGSPNSSYGQQYLHPPSMAEWRRVRSDPALHKSPTDNSFIPLVIPDSSTSEDSSNNSNDPRDMFQALSGIVTGTGTIRTPQDSPNSQMNNGMSHLGVTPQNISTGSLPDLTNTGGLQFPLQMDPSAAGGYGSAGRPPGNSGVYQTNPPVSSHPLTITLGLLNSPPQHQQQQQQQQGMSPNSVQSPGAQSQHSPGILDNSLHVNSPFQNFGTADNPNMYNYRCPPRPSPQSSPLPFRSPSPLENHLSNPPSPITGQNQNPSADAYVLQQSFEQISMNDHTLNNGSWQGGALPKQDYYYNPNAMQQSGNGQHQQQLQQPATPQTPGSIPEIILSEFLGADLTDVEQLLQADINAMRDTIDSDGLEMLRDPNLIITSEPNAEDTFRLDRLDCEREIADFFNSH